MCFYVTDKKMKKEIIYRLLIIGHAVLLLCSCSQMKSRCDEKHVPSLLRTNDPAPKYVVILPFKNSSTKENLDVDVRRTFYNHFSSKNYYDFELHDVDEALKVMNKLYSREWRLFSPEEIGKYFNADFLIYGEVLGFKKLYLGIYSQIAITVKVTMIETQSGKTAWTETVLKRVHQGDFPLNPFSLFSASVRCGLQMQKEKTDDLVDRVCRNLVDKIPDPNVSRMSAFWVDIQIGSFRDKIKARKLAEDIQGKGFSARIEKASFKRNYWYRVLLGPYGFAEAKEVKRIIAKNKQLNPFIIQHSHITAAGSKSG